MGLYTLKESIERREDGYRREILYLTEELRKTKEELKKTKELLKAAQETRNY